MQPVLLEQRRRCTNEDQSAQKRVPEELAPSDKRAEPRNVLGLYPVPPLTNYYKCGNHIKQASDAHVITIKNTPFFKVVLFQTVRRPDSRVEW